MARVLVAEEFVETSLDKVKEFDCGTEGYALHATRWIQAASTERGALQSKVKHGTRVWLYFDPEGALVGFGSLGLTQWPEFPKKVSIIPQLAIQQTFRGQPTGEDEVKYSHQILDDLIGLAKTQDTDWLVLTVDPTNARAIALYKSFGFLEFPKRNPFGHVKMGLLLREPSIG